MAISDVLLEGGLTFKTYIDKGRGGRLKSEYFRGRHLWMAPYLSVQCIKYISRIYILLHMKKKHYFIHFFACF